MIRFGLWHPYIEIFAVLCGYAIAAVAFVAYTRTNDRSLPYFGVGLVLLATTFLLPLLPTDTIRPSTILTANFVLLFACYALIGYGILLLWKRQRHRSAVTHADR